EGDAPRGAVDARALRHGRRRLRAVRRQVVDDRDTRPAVDAVRREEGGADVARPQRVAAHAAAPIAPALDLREGVHGEAPRALEPALVARARERLQQRVAVPGGAVAD